MKRTSVAKPRRLPHRQAILSAAEVLIRSSRATHFSMLELAKSAGVSPATPYNIFGTKDSILYELLNNSLTGIFTKFAQSPAEREPHEVVLSAAAAAAAYFVRDPDFYRPLYQHLIGVSDPVHRPAYMDRALQYWRTALGPLIEAGSIGADVERDTIARAIMIHFIGALDMWVQREVSSKEFHAHIMHGVASVLLGCVAPPSRLPLEKTLRAALRAMPRGFSFIGA